MNLHSLAYTFAADSLYIKMCWHIFICHSYDL